MHIQMLPFFSDSQHCTNDNILEKDCCSRETAPIAGIQRRKSFNDFENNRNKVPYTSLLLHHCHYYRLFVCDDNDSKLKENVISTKQTFAKSIFEENCQCLYEYWPLNGSRSGCSPHIPNKPKFKTDEFFRFKKFSTELHFFQKRWDLETCNIKHLSQHRNKDKKIQKKTQQTCCNNNLIISSHDKNDIRQASSNNSQNNERKITNKELHSLEAKLGHQPQEEELLHTWVSKFLPKWQFYRNSKKVHNLFWLGLPSEVRETIWTKEIKNMTDISFETYVRCSNQFNQEILSHVHHKKEEDLMQDFCEKFEGVSVFSQLSREKQDCIGCNFIHSRLNSNALRFAVDRDEYIKAVKQDFNNSFPELQLFQLGQAYHENLHKFLGAYIFFRPDVGYIQGMSTIAALMLLQFKEVEAFVLFANTMESKFFQAFYSQDELDMNVYRKTFELILEANVPGLMEHFHSCYFDVSHVIQTWIFSGLSTKLNAKASVRIWDIYIRDGPVAFFRASVGLLKRYKELLLTKDGDEIERFIGEDNRIRQEIGENEIIRLMRQIKLHVDEDGHFEGKLHIMKVKNTSGFEHLVNSVSKKYFDVESHSNELIQ